MEWNFTNCHCPHVHDMCNSCAVLYCTIKYSNKFHPRQTLDQGNQSRPSHDLAWSLLQVNHESRVDIWLVENGHVGCS